MGKPSILGAFVTFIVKTTHLISSGCIWDLRLLHISSLRIGKDDLLVIWNLDWILQYLRVNSPVWIATFRIYKHTMLIWIRKHRAILLSPISCDLYLVYNILIRLRHLLVGMFELFLLAFPVILIPYFLFLSCLM